MKTYTIAIIDDEKDLCDTLAQGLKKAGLKTVIARNGQEGLELIQSDRPDLILLDISMPKMDGIEMLSKFRETEPPGTKTPVIILTNIDDFARMSEAIELGAVGYLQKSEWHLNDVVKKIRETLGISA